MIIEIRKAGFVNKGGELMLHAVVQQLRSRYPDAILTMSPVFGGSDDTFEKMQALKLYPKAWIWSKGINFGKFAEHLPSKLLNRYGLITDREVDVVLDAAGFAYSDQWGLEPCKELSHSSTRWKKNGTKLILLPQALGPFEHSSKQKKYIKNIVNNASLIFAREIDSYNNIVDVVGKTNKIAMSPDFTNLVSGILPDNYDKEDKRIAIVPNFRMIDKTEAIKSDAYIPFLIKCTKYLLENDKKPFILIHDSMNDKSIANKVSEAVGGVPVVMESDPIKIKGILGSCDATIGSRFHGLVSALSQGIPSLATGWSHKYYRLFEDYDYQDGIIDVLDSDSVLFKKIDMIVDTENSTTIKRKLNAKSIELKESSKNMWDRVFTEIDDLYK